MYPSAPLRPISAASPFTNAVAVSTDGWDVELFAAFDLGDSWSYSTDFNLTDIMTFRVNTGTEIDEYVGTQSSYNLSSGAGTPRWRGSWAHTLKYDVASVTATINYVSGEKEYGLDAGSTVDPVTHQLTGCLTDLINNCTYGGFWDVDLTSQYQLTDKIQLFGTIKNLFDAKPPLDEANYAGVNYNPTYNQAGIVGRFYQIGITIKD